MDLIIVESPTKARTLSRFLGSDYDVVATVGHIKDLPKSKLGLDIEKDFEPLYEVVAKRAPVISELKERAKKSQTIFIATDPDREGEAIARHVKEILSEKDIKILSAKNKKNRSISQYRNILISRIVFHEITKEAVEAAIKNPRDIDANLVDAQIARRVLDRLVGYKLSPLLWKKVRRGLSAGRVQTVVVRLIVEREREIEKFKKEEYWEVFCTVSSQQSAVSGQRFVVQLVKIGEKKADIGNKEQADRVVTDLEKANYKILAVDKKEVRKNPYPPFTTSTMTQAAARLFYWSAKRTMTVAQKLYEEGLITYHRTDSTNIAAVAIDKVRRFISEKYGENHLPPTPRFYKTKSKVAQEAHEAIRPTNVGSMSNDKLQMPNDGKKLYDLIWKRFIACQMAAAVYDETTIDVEAYPTPGVKAQNTPGVYLLRASGQVMKFDGWRRVMEDGRWKMEDGEKLPDVTKDEELQLIKVDPQQKFTEPPPRYNEASLIKTLEKLGIGRPSTYAPIISVIQVRSYVEKKEGKFFATPVGFAVNDFLLANFADVFDYQFTAQMEDNLDKIANGEKKWREEIGAFWNPLEKKVEKVTEKAKRVKIEVERLGKPCPLCGGEGGLPRKNALATRTRSAREQVSSVRGELVIRTGRFGKFISCSRFPDCKYTEKYVEKVGLKCPECKTGDVIVKRTKKGRNFFGCSRYPDCKWASWRKPQTTDQPHN